MKRVHKHLVIIINILLFLFVFYNACDASIFYMKVTPTETCKYGIYTFTMNNTENENQLLIKHGTEILQIIKTPSYRCLTDGKCVFYTVTELQEEQNYYSKIMMYNIEDNTTDELCIISEKKECEIIC